MNGDRGVCSSLLFDLLKVELKLFALEDVAITTSALAGAGGNASEELSGSELINDLLVLVGVGGAGGDFLGPSFAVLGFSAGLFGVLDLLLVELNVVVSEVPARC